jgi:N-carbamoyl-L-amino-acid hydrolase
VDAIRDAAAQYARDGHVSLDFEAESITPIVAFPEAPRRRLQAALSRFGDVPVLPTAAGHDAGILSAKVPTAMLFVRNPTGISHSPNEYAEITDCRTGAEALADVMADWVSQ